MSLLRTAPQPGSTALLVAIAVAAAAAPSLLAWNTPPSPTFLNQALAFALWAAFALASSPARAPASAPALLASGARAARGAWALQAAIGVLMLSAAASGAFGALPSPLALSAVATLAAAVVLVAAGAGVGARAEGLFAAFCWAWVVAGGLNVAIALVQVFAPEWADGDWLAVSGYPGRAVGNLRQPNHLSSLLLWHCIAVIALLDMRRIGRGLAAGLLALGVFAVVLTASRTGLVSVLLLALWGLLDRRLSRPARWLLLAAPLVYLLSWLGMAEWAKLSQHAFGGSARLAESDISSSRFAIWRDTLALIRMQPWAGVGFGEFNIAWTLTPFPQRPTAFFDHAHNLPLQLAAEIGLPLASLVMALLGCALWRGVRGAWSASASAPAGAAGMARRSALLMVLMIGLHSLLEYPLWYSYFLLPAAWAFGFALQADGVDSADSADSARAARAPSLVSSRPLAWLSSAAALLVVIGSALSVLDYVRVAAIFSAGPGAAPLAQRVAEGQRSVFFAHHADYAAVTSGLDISHPEVAFDRASHYLLDTRLMMAWARSLAERGQTDQARYLAARLREFRKADAAEFFADCPLAALPAAAGLPFQCEQPQQAHGWRDFLPR